MKIRKPISLFLIVIFCFYDFALAFLPDEEKIVIAVVDFRNTGEDKKLDYLEKTIPENIITRMAKSGKTEIVERTRLQDALKEMKLGLSGIIDEQSAVELGRAVGATAILLGSYASIGSQIRINARLINVKSSRIIKAEVVQGNVANEIFQLMDQVAASMESQLLNQNTGSVQYQPIPINKNPVETVVKKKKPIYKSPLFWVAVVGVGVGAGIALSSASEEEKEKMATVKIIFNLP